jgi:hypothetical protein
MLELHCRYNAKGDELSELPEQERHKVLTPEELSIMSHEDPSRAQIEKRIESGYLEIIVIIEGIEPTTSSTIQARHSYLIGQGGPDVQYDHMFVDCVTLPQSGPMKGTKGLVLDVSQFHSLKPDAKHGFYNNQKLRSASESDLTGFDSTKGPKGVCFKSTPAAALRGSLGKSNTSELSMSSQSSLRASRGGRHRRPALE